MTAPVADPTAVYYTAQAATAATAAEEVAALWATVSLANIEASWGEVAGQVLALIAAGQARAAATAQAYQGALLRAGGLEPRAPRIVPAGFAGYTGDGIPLPQILGAVPYWAQADLGRGIPPEQVKAKTAYRLSLLAQAEAQKAGSRAQFVGRNLDRRFVGWERVVEAGACARCVVLAGRRYKRNADFLRHPGCRCQARDVTEDDGDETSDASKFFRSLSAEEQDRRFTKAGAAAIRAGADISQVVNARKGALGLTPAGARITAAEAKTLRNGLERGRLQPQRVYGRDVFVTTAGTTVRSASGKKLIDASGGVKAPGRRYTSATVPRLMPESLLEIAGGDEELFRRLLTRFGYITG